MSFANTLKNLLEEHEISQADLAKSIGYSQRAVSKWVNKQAEPSESAICLTANFFNMSADEIMGREEILGNVTVQSSALSPVGEKLTDNERTLLNWYRGLPSEKARASFLSFVSSSGEMFAAKRN